MGDGPALGFKNPFPRLDVALQQRRSGNRNAFRLRRARIRTHPSSSRPGSSFQFTSIQRTFSVRHRRACSDRETFDTRCTCGRTFAGSTKLVEDETLPWTLLHQHQHHEYSPPCRRVRGLRHKGNGSTIARRDGVAAGKARRKL